MTFDYPFKVEAGDKHGYVVQFLDIEEAITCGETIEECKHNAEEVLTAMLEIRLENDEPIPLPSSVDTGYKVSPSVAVQAALLVRLAKDETRKNTSDLARAMGVTWPVADKLTNPHHYPNLRQLDKAARALGKRLYISFG